MLELLRIDPDTDKLVSDVGVPLDNMYKVFTGHSMLMLIGACHQRFISEVL